MKPLGGTPRTSLKRLRGKEVTDRGRLRAILDAGRVAHLGFVADGHPTVIPVAYARDGESVLFHGSTGSRLFRALAAGTSVCFEVTLLDGLVLARSAFESSMHYRSVMAFGVAAPVDETAAKLAALQRVSDHLFPGRWAEVRPPSAKELAATLVLALSLTECSVKVSDGPPEDADEDLARPCWAGVIPIREVLGPPVDAPDLAPGLVPPDYLASWR